VPYTCPACGATSHHPDDALNGYCGNCHSWTGRCAVGRRLVALPVAAPTAEVAELADRWDTECPAAAVCGYLFLTALGQVRRVGVCTDHSWLLDLLSGGQVVCLPPWLTLTVA
jgi:hypothetical protein